MKVVSNVMEPVLPSHDKLIAALPFVTILPAFSPRLFLGYAGRAFDHAAAA